MNKRAFVMLLAVLFWSGAFIAGKFTANVIDPVTITFLRFLIAALILAGYRTLRGMTWRFDRLMLAHSLILAIVGMTGYHLLFYKALELTSAIHASLIAATNPFFTYMLSIAFLKSRIRLRRLVYILMALTGVALIITDFSLSSVMESGLNAGDLWMFAAVFCWAVYSILVKRFIVRYDPMYLTTMVFIMTVIVLAPFADFSVVSRLFTYPAAVVWSMLYMGFFPTVLGYMIQQYSIKEIGPERTNIFINLVPVSTAVLSFLVLGERMGLPGILSGIGVVGCVYLFNTSR